MIYLLTAIGLSPGGTVLVFYLPVYLFSIKICISEKGCKINGSIELDQVRVLW